MLTVRSIGAVTALVAVVGTTSAATLTPTASAVPAPAPAPATAAAPDPAVDTLQAAAEAAYTYTYPLVTMEVSRRKATNVPVPIPGQPAAPTNQPGSLTEVPQAGFTSVVRPNVDTLYTSMFYDVSKQPLVVSMPDADGRFQLAEVMDAWSNVEASPGSRTYGEDVGAYAFALVGPDWHGTLPDGVREVRVDTSTGWVLTRYAVDAEDPDDVTAANALQKQIEAVPLSRYGSTYVPPVNLRLHPDWPSKDDQVSTYIDDLSAQEYWDLYYEARSHAQPRPEDDALLADLAGFGWSPSTPLDLDALSRADRRTWEAAKPAAIADFSSSFGVEPVNGWETLTDDIGDYGTDYAARAGTAYHLFAANKPEDAAYATSEVDVDGRPYDAGTDYVLHLDADQVPDVHAFWSITMYDEDGFLVENPIDRSAVRGERLATNPDGSVDVYVQSDSPGADLESNWLPAPADGGFTLALRAYWPGDDVLDGSWVLPGVTPVS